MPQPSYAHNPAAFAVVDCGAQRGHLETSQDYWGLLEPNHSYTSYVSSCAVDSAQQNSCPMDWAAAMPCAAAAAGDAPQPTAAGTMRSSVMPSTLINHTAAARAEDPLGSAAAAAAAASNPWAWLSDVAVGGGGSDGGNAAAPAPACAPTQGAALPHCHTTSRRLFSNEAQNPTKSMQWKLQQQAQQLQAQLAAATQQLQMHSIAFHAPPVTMAR